jgi:hypothetical protein
MRKPRGHGEVRLRLAEICGRFAAFCHAGVFALPKVEENLQGYVSPSQFPTGYRSELRNVENKTLHVITEAYPIGGHTRLVTRWIEVLGEEKHAIVLVRQRCPVPESLVNRNTSKTTCINLAQETTTHEQKVAYLASLMRVARRVILHIHMDDACSVAAAYQNPAAEIHFLNHADHLAWLGAGLPITFLNLRQRGIKICRSRRGIPIENCGNIPVPITMSAKISRQDARKRLGISERDCVVLSIASEFKFTPIGERSMHEPLARISRRKNLKMIFIGPRPENPFFARLRENNPEKVWCLGPIPDPTLYRAAADIYLDSYPFGSITSMLEAAASGLPIVAYQPDFEQLEILYSECPWLANEQYVARTEDELFDLLTRLIDDKNLRETLSQLSVSGVEPYLPEAWRKSTQEHLRKSFRKSPWQPKNVHYQDDLMDCVIAGLLGNMRINSVQRDISGTARMVKVALAMAQRAGLI